MLQRNMWSTLMTLSPVVLEDTMKVSEYLQTKYSDFIMVSANMLEFKDMLDALVTLNPMVSVETMVMYNY